jgi:hypothetical protein
VVSHAEAIKDLRICVGKKWNHLWHGERGISCLRKGADVALVERAMKIILPWNPAGACYKLHDDYVAIAWRVLAKAKASTDVTFLRTFEGDDDAVRLRAGSAWLLEARMVDASPRNRKRLPGLVADARGLAAARAAVVAHGVESEQLLAVLAHDGTADSLDAIVDSAHSAISERGDPLDAMIEWFVPFARGRDMTALAKELVDARDERGAASPLTGMFGDKKQRLSLEVGIDSREMHAGYLRRAGGHVVLRSHARPNAEAFISYYRKGALDDDFTMWKDGKKVKDELRIGSPAGVDDLPRWFADAAVKLKFTWDRSTMLVTSTLRGKARRQALDWLFPEAPPSPKKTAKKPKKRR